MVEPKITIVKKGMLTFRFSMVDALAMAYWMAMTKPSSDYDECREAWRERPRGTEKALDGFRSFHRMGYCYSTQSLFETGRQIPFEVSQ